MPPPPFSAAAVRPLGLPDDPAPAAHMVVVVSGRADASDTTLPLVRAGLPGLSVVLEPNVGQALSRAETARRFGRESVLFIVDIRGESPEEAVAHLQRIRRAHAGLDLICIIDPREGQTVTTLLRTIDAPDRLTFLTTPFDARTAVETFRAVGQRRRAHDASSRETEEASAVIFDLERRNEELHSRLEVAKHAARHDALTGAMNRTGFVESLTARLSRGRQRQSLLIVDLDRFKAVNDTLGHAAGDDLVKKICVAMGAVVPSGGVLARLGGDEFGILVEGVSDPGVEALCQQVIQVCGKTRMIFGHEVQVTASVGVAHQGAVDSEVELMRQADLALYAAKREGRNRHRVFDAALDRATCHRLSIESGLERGLRSGQFSMNYQPIVHAADARVLGYEALVRWNSPEHGAISPADFIPVAEDTGLILDIGDWIARQSLKDCRRLGLPYVSINLSVRQFLRHNVGERMLRYAADADVHPGRIQIELTETAIIDDVERADYNLRVLRDAGVRVALDDFGTGYSSLVYLNQFAIDCIKIDRSFVENIARDRQSAVIVASVAKLAESLGMSVIAEGVETADQRQALIACGCDALQGYYFGRPVPPKALADLAGLDPAKFSAA